MALSFLDYLDVPALESAVAAVPARQRAEHLAVQPKADIAPLAKGMIARQQAGQQEAIQVGRLGVLRERTALGGRRDTLAMQELDRLREARAFENRLTAGKLNLAASASDFENRLAPYAYGVGALNVGVNAFAGYRALEETKRAAATQQGLQDLLRQQLVAQQASWERQRPDIERLQSILDAARSTPWSSTSGAQ